MSGVGGYEWLFLLRVSCVGDGEALPYQPQGGQWAFREPQAGVARGLTPECFLCARHSAKQEMHNSHVDPAFALTSRLV